MVSHTQAEVEEPESGFAGFSALSILRTIWKRKIRITVAWVLFALCAVAVVRSLPRVYLAETVVLIDSQKIPDCSIIVPGRHGQPHSSRSGRAGIRLRRVLRPLHSQDDLEKKDPHHRGVDTLRSLCGRRGALATEGVPVGYGGTDRLAKDPGLLHNSTGKTWSATLKQKWKSRNPASPGSPPSPFSGRSGKERSA